MTLMCFFISLTATLKGSSTTLAAQSPVHWPLKSPSRVDAGEFDIGFVRSTRFSQASESFRWWSSSLHEARSGMELRLIAIDGNFIFLHAVVTFSSKLIADGLLAQTMQRCPWYPFSSLVLPMVVHWFCGQVFYTQIRWLKGDLVHSVTCKSVYNFYVTCFSRFLS